MPPCSTEIGECWAGGEGIGQVQGGQLLCNWSMGKVAAPIVTLGGAQDDQGDERFFLHGI